MQEWLDGVSEPTSRDEDLDKYYDFISQVVQSFLPWVCRAFEILQQFFEIEVTRREWPLYADFVENGVDTLWAVSAITSGCPVSRTAIAPFGRAIERKSGAMMDGRIVPLEITGKDFDKWLSDAALDAKRDKDLIMPPSDEEINQLIFWIQIYKPPDIG